MTRMPIPEPDLSQHRDAATETPLVNGEDPFVLFAQWFADAEKAEPCDPNAMSLATVDETGMPNVRMVLLKALDERGFVFYSNTESQKGLEIQACPKVALCFHWKSLLRQVRVQGTVERVAEGEAEAYFQSRPRGSRIGAWVSAQSRPLLSRGKLVQDVLMATAQYGIGHIPKPPFWQGFRVLPVRFEFWHHGAFRLHDRLVFTPSSLGNAGERGWQAGRVYP